MKSKMVLNSHPYRGDIINSIEFTKEARTPNPENMLQAYNQGCSLPINPTRAIPPKGGNLALT